MLKMKKHNTRSENIMKTLEDILNVLGSKKPFLKEIKIYDDGTWEPFTKSGGKAYSKLTNILYTVGALTEKENEIERIIVALDDIASGYDY